MGPSLSRKLVEQEVANFELKLKQSAINPASQLTGWVYWQRDPRGSPNCWTKVFAVLDSAFLRLFQREESAPRSLLLQVAVASAEEHDGRLLQVLDLVGEQLCISLYEDDTFELWESRLKEAADLTNAFFCTLEGPPALKTMDRNQDAKRTRWRLSTGETRTRESEKVIPVQETLDKVVALKPHTNIIIVHWLLTFRTKKKLASRSLPSLHDSASSANTYQSKPLWCHGRIIYGTSSSTGREDLN